MKKISLFIFGTLVLASCNKEPKFNIKGAVSDAEGKMLYLEASGIDGVEPLDSVKLKSDGEFSFKQLRPESPEFYRLRIDEKVINFSVDSTENLDVKAKYGDFSTGYTIAGSENCAKIKELTLMQIELQNKIDGLVKATQQNKITNDIFQDSVSGMISRYKDKVKTKYIFAAPNMTYAYFALFQRIGDYYAFDPMNSKEDIRCFQAVATSLTNAYPNAVRTKNLYNVVIKGLKNTRPAKQKMLQIPINKISEAGLIDIDLKDVQGVSRKLSQLKGKVVLLDFVVYQSQASAEHNLNLRDLYNKYASKGLQIYQVSLDADEHYWKTVTDKLPWICVRDEDGAESRYISLYNIKNVPTLFLINKNNELNSRFESLKNIESGLQKLL
jgi:peroxiredoxin